MPHTRIARLWRARQETRACRIMECLVSGLPKKRTSDFGRAIRDNATKHLYPRYGAINPMAFQS